MKRQIILKTLREVGLHYFKELDQKELKSWIQLNFKCSPYLAKTCSEILIKEIQQSEKIQNNKKGKKTSVNSTRPTTERSPIR